MKRNIAVANRKFFPSFELRLSPKSAVKFVAECLLLFLMASVKDFGFALAVAAFCGLVYARQNILAISPAYVIACVVFSLSWQTLLFSLAPILILIALYAICFRMKKNVPIWAMCLSAFVAMTPYAAVGCAMYGRYVLMPIAMVTAVAATFVFSAVSYAVLVRRATHAFALDELASIGVVWAIFGYALYGVGGYGFSLIYAVVAFASLFLVITGNSKYILLSAALLAIGGAACARDISVLGTSVVAALACFSLSPFKKWASAVGMLSATAIMWGIGGTNWQTLVMYAAGGICALVLPKSALERFAAEDADNSHAYTGIVNRRGREIAAKLMSAGEVFFDMSKKMEELAAVKTEYSAKRLASEIANGYCAKCGDIEACRAALGGSTACVIEPAADAALSRGKATILDLPPYLANRCSRMRSLVGVINSSAEAYLVKREQSDSVALTKRLMAEQFAGIALALDSLSTECAGQVGFCDGDTDNLRGELMRHNIVASEIVISRDEGNVNVTLAVREEDAMKSILPKIVSREIKMRLDVARIEDRGEKKLVYLESAPMFEIAYGVAEKIREERGVSGDTRSISCPSRNKRLFAICDGMGSGEAAAAASRDAVAMIEGFYRAGFDGKIVLSLVNKMLKLSLDECYSTVDIGVIDTSTGGLDVIKLGSANSFIVRKDSIESLSCTQPPAGILDSVKVLTSRYQLYDGDMLVMMSDGVFDALDTVGVADVIDTLGTSNPQTLADGLIDMAALKGAKDDCTALVMRLFAT